MGPEFSIEFGDPAYLWLLVLPAALAGVWVWRLVQRMRDVRRFREQRLVPVAERFPRSGDLLLWLCVIVATGFVIVALARPKAPLAAVRRAGIDLVVLQDGSASMHVRDVRPNRWQRSMTFVRRLAEAMHWSDDRIALALFANIAAPQVRLTRDANTLFFFLDHLAEQPTFSLEVDTTWDTNMEAGVYWGMRLVEKDEELHGASPNSKAFVLISDGQAWSGKVQQSLRLARERDIPVYVVGVGTTGGGYIPEPPRPATDATPASRVFSVLDRASLLEVASAGHGRYFEIDRESDRAIASMIVEAVRRRAGSRGVERTFRDLYPQSLLAAAAFVCLGVLGSRNRRELWLLAVGGAGALLLVWPRLG